MSFLCKIGFHLKQAHPHAATSYNGPNKLMCILCGMVREMVVTGVTELSDGTKIEHKGWGPWK